MSKTTIDPSAYMAIDPLALIFSTRIYLILMEILHPRTPVMAAIEQVVADMSAEEKRAALAHATRLTEYAKAVTDAIHKAGGH